MADLPARNEMIGLPLRALVAYAARCARRVRPEPERAGAEYSAAVEAAILAAERFAMNAGRTVVEEAEAAADAAAAAAEALPPDEEGDRYSAAYAASYAARAAAAAAFSADATEGLDFGAFTEAVKEMGGTATAEAAIENVVAASEAAKAAAMGKVSHTTALDDPPALAAEAANVARARADLRRLSQAVPRAAFGELGEGVDPSGSGPMGAL